MAQGMRSFRAVSFRWCSLWDSATETLSNWVQVSFSAFRLNLHSSDQQAPSSLLSLRSLTVLLLRDSQGKFLAVLRDVADAAKD